MSIKTETPEERAERRERWDVQNIIESNYPMRLFGCNHDETFIIASHFTMGAFDNTAEFEQVTKWVQKWKAINKQKSQS